MLKKILLFNRRFIRRLTPLMFSAGALLLIILGSSILAGNFPNPDMSSYPVWQGYLMFYGGLVFMIGYVIDFGYKVISSFIKSFKLKPKSLKDKMAEYK